MSAKTLHAIAKACKTIKLCVYYNLIGYISGERIYFLPKAAKESRSHDYNVGVRGQSHDHNVGVRGQSYDHNVGVRGQSHDHNVGVRGQSHQFYGPLALQAR